MVLPLLYFLWEFSLYFPRRLIPPSKIVKTTIQLWVLAFIAITLFTSLVGRQEIITGFGQRETIYGFLYPLYILHYLVAAGFVIAHLAYKHRVSKDKQEKQQAALRQATVEPKDTYSYGFEKGSVRSQDAGQITPAGVYPVRYDRYNADALLSFLSNGV